MEGPNLGKIKSLRVRVKRGGGGLKLTKWLNFFIKSLREPFDVPNGLEKL